MFPDPLRERLILVPLCLCFVDDCGFGAVEMLLCSVVSSITIVNTAVFEAINTTTVFLILYHVLIGSRYTTLSSEA